MHSILPVPVVIIGSTLLFYINLPLFFRPFSFPGSLFLSASFCGVFPNTFPVFMPTLPFYIYFFKVLLVLLTLCHAGLYISFQFYLLFPNLLYFLSLYQFCNPLLLLFPHWFQCFFFVFSPVFIFILSPHSHYASPTSGEAYRDRRLTTNFEL